MTAARQLFRGLLVAFMLCWAFAAAADVAVPPLTGRVVDLTSTLSAGEVARLEQKLKDFEDRKGSQIAVLIVPTTAPETIEQYSLRVVEQWKLGRKKIDDGALLIVAKDDRRLRIEVGYALEGVLPDATARRIIDEVITPKFRTGDFAGGINDGVDRMLRVIDGEPLPAPRPRSTVSGDDLGQFIPIAIIMAILIGGFLRALLGPLLGALVTGGGVGLITWSVIGVLSISGIAGVIAFFITLMGASFGGGRGGGYILPGGGGFSRGGGGFRNDGGFSGGGGGFGGGGASGRW